MLALLAFLPSCAFIQSLAALSQVRFELDGVTGLRIAGVQVDRVRDYEELTFTDITRIATAVSGGTLPLDLTLRIVADNPRENPEARLVALDWTLFLHDRETVGGSLDREVLLPPDTRTEVPVVVRLDLLAFFQGSAGDLVDLVLSLTNADGEPVAVRVEVSPTVETPLGPIRYPRPLVLGSAQGS